MRVAITRKFPTDLAERLRPHFSEVTAFDRVRPPSPEELQRLVAHADLVICSPSERIDAALIAAAPELKCVITYSVGVDHVDLAALAARQIRLVHTPKVLTDATADLAWALIMACTRRLKPAQQYIDEERFTGIDPCLFLGLELSRAVLGIVGMGKIGGAVAQRALAFGMKILYTGSERQDLSLPGRRVELIELLTHSDVVTLHVPLTDKTRHLIGRRELGVMKAEAVLVNTSRGPVIDEKALLAHLRTHPGFFAGLDVYENEPEITAGLSGLPNAFCVPHIGSATVHARRAMADLCADEAIRFAKGERLRYEYAAGV
jgi:glyoxylate reductase